MIRTNCVTHETAIRELGKQINALELRVLNQDMEIKRLWDAILKLQCR